MILVFGSLNIDLSFSPPHLPARGETVLSPSYRTGPGGKGLNQAVAAARAGAATAMFGRLGDDGFGARLRRTLAAEGIDASGVLAGRLPTACATIAVDAEGHNQIIVGSGANGEATADQVPDRILTPAATLLLQLEVPVAESLALARRARAAGARVVLNAAPAALLPADALEAVDILVLNEVEATMLGGDGDPARAARRLAQDAAATVVLTLGAAGAAAFAGPRSWHVGALPIRAVDSVGAGDCFVGVLAARLDAGDELPAALRWAAVAGGLACLAPGAVDALPVRSAIAGRLHELAPAVAA